MLKAKVTRNMQSISNIWLSNLLNDLLQLAKCMH